MSFSARRRYYEEEKPRTRIEAAKTHPLLSNSDGQQRTAEDSRRVSTVKVSLTTRGDASKQMAKTVSAAFDPLSATIGTPLDESVMDDPLSLASKASDSRSTAIENGNAARTERRAGKTQQADGNAGDSELHDSKAEDYFEPWHVRKTQILAKFTTSERLSIVTGILSRRDDVEQVSVKVQARSSVENKVRKRLELLDELDEMNASQAGGGGGQPTVETREVSQAEYVMRIDEMNRAINAAWNEDQRVRALKIVIQCAKLLGSVETVSFYPSKFVLVTDVLDAFGKLVCRRLVDKSSSSSSVGKLASSKANMATSSPSSGGKSGAKRSGKLEDSLLDDETSQDGGYDSAAPASSASVTESTRETARNWFLKVAVIRELLPRFYVETSLMRATRFLDPAAIMPGYLRLARVTRGFGDPLVAAYARLFVARCAIESCPADALKDESLGECLRLLFIDLLDSMQRVFANAEMVRSALTSNRLTFAKYVAVYQPVLDFVVHCVAVRCNDRPAAGSSDNEAAAILARSTGGWALSFVVNEVRKYCITGSLVQAVLGGFPPATIARRADLLYDLLTNATEIDVSRPVLLKQLGVCLALASRADLEFLAAKAPERITDQADQSSAVPASPLRFRISVLNDVYRKIFIEGTLTIDEYVQNVEVWTELFLRYVESTEEAVVAECNSIGTILTNLVERVTPDRAFESYYGPLLNILNKCLSNCSQPERLFVSGPFERYLALFQKESCKMDAFKQNLEAFFQRYIARIAADSTGQSSGFISDTVLVSTLMQYAKALHDSVTVLTLFDDQRIISRLIGTLVNLVRYDDVEEQLQFYVDCRASFHMLESVQVMLVNRVSSLSMQVHRLCFDKASSKSTTSSQKTSQPNRKIQAFQHACAAFCFITVPSLGSVSHKLRLYLLSGQTALLTGCSAQAEACFEAFLTVLLEATDAELLEDPAFGTLSSVQTVGGPPPTLAAAQNGLLDVLRAFMSTVLYVPDNPRQKAHLTLLRKLLAFVQGAAKSNGTDNPETPTRKDGSSIVVTDAFRCEAYLSALELLLAYAQPKYAYHPQILGLNYNELSGSLVSANFALLSASSNDMLYCNDESFQRSIRKLLVVVTNELLRILHAQASSIAITSQQSAIALAAAAQQSAIWSNVASKFLQIVLTGLDLTADVPKDAESGNASVATLLSNVTQLLVALQPTRQVRAKLARVCERVARTHYPNDNRVSSLLQPIATQLSVA